ncbi:hypothetical protein C1H46_033237 [Malus baccata]|uniref:THH1/TOM1/TOM3 domain-containing protein n=1 Tax=Malus baccata TaxID=106549 RepID=A0A540L410_MALBA|nr:hypothetical protein C1H46_033237 [Malus baccata]
MFGLREGSCFPRVLVGVYVGLALVDGIIALLAFYQGWQCWSNSCGFTLMGLLLYLRMRNVRSERASSEMWKVAGLAVVSVLCFASSSLVALFTDIPMLYDWHQRRMKDVYTSVLLILYYFVGSSIPSAFVLWVMRELPPSVTANTREEPSTLTFISDISTTLQDPQSWNAAMSLRNQHVLARQIYEVSRNQRTMCQITSATLRGRDEEGVE